MIREVPAHLRRLVIKRAKSRCEYCGLSQEGQEAAFHVDHVVPRVAGGTASAENLALACVSCSLHKAARRTASDSETGGDVPLFHPHQDDWAQHFRWDGVRLVGVTASGRATVAALQMNRPLILAIRREEAALGRHPSR